MRTSDLVMYYLITGRTTCGKRIEHRSKTLADARDSWETIVSLSWFPPLTLTLWRVDPHHRRHREPGYRLTRAATAATLTSRPA